VSFWRKQLQDLGVGLATLPIAAVVGALAFGTLYNFVDFTEHTWVFFVVAIPFLIGWMLFDRWVIKRVVGRSRSKGEDVQKNPDR
jgi:hypothetical protein